MNIWVVSDTHFGHTLLQQKTHRPVNADQIMLSNIEYIHMAPLDLFIHLGDICIGNDSFWHKQLRLKVKGRMLLVLGNHDKRSISWYFDHGWDMVVNRFDLKRFGKRIAFTHEPIQIEDSFDLNIHGHLHNNTRITEYPVRKNIHKLVMMEHHYKPIKLQTIINT